MADCPHLSTASSLSPPKLSQSVHSEECTQCFDNQDLPSGVDVCLTCFNGGCVNDERHHARTHFERLNHPLVVNVKRKAKPRPERGDNEPPLKKIAIVEEREEDRYTFETVVRCWACGGVEVPHAMEDPKVQELVQGVMQSMSSARQSEVKSWEEDITACEHALLLEQTTSFVTPDQGLAKCVSCDLKENLWLCLTCGNLGCGRAQYGGVGGNGHGLEHFNTARHPISVKLGTITAEGTADIYCYECNDSRLDPDLAAHLSTFGINVLTQKKTEKSITELQIEHNLKFDFSMTGDDGKALEPVYGPGFTGLANLGNSCYMASVIQTIFSLPTFQERYLPNAETHSTLCAEALPGSCLECQMHKLADGLLSGRYSHPRQHPDPNAIIHSPSPDAPQDTSPTFQEGLKPSMFKALVGKGHEEFSTMRQQDAEEFLAYLLKCLRQEAKKRARQEDDEPTRVFKFGMEQKLQCSECQKVRYRVDSQDSVSIPVPAVEKPPASVTEGGDPPQLEYEPVELEQCLVQLLSQEALEYNCPSCAKNVVAHKITRFSTFPQVLVIHAKKFQLVNWVPVKLDIPIILPTDDLLTLDEYLSPGTQAGEELLPEEAAPAPQPAFDRGILDQLESMGFTTPACQRALLATGNNSAEAATAWIFEHLEDPDLNDPLPSATSAVPEPSEEQIVSLREMGFTSAQARKALKETGGNMERAVEWLFNHPDDTGEDAEMAGPSASVAPAANPGGSATLPARYRLKAFISHKGTSVHSGHYVAHIRTEKDGWVLFNDEKVVKTDGESVNSLKALAYLYIFERI